MFIFKAKSGISTIISMLVVSAAALLMVIAVLFVSIDETKTFMHYDNASKTFAASDGCAEKALLELSGNHSYMGETYTLEGTVCIINVTGAGNARTVKISSVYQLSYTRKIEVDIDWSSGFKITAWRDTAD